MTITAEGSGTVLYFSKEELRAIRPSPDYLDLRIILPLIRTALISANQPVPRNPEIRLFQARRGVLIFVLPETVFPNRESCAAHLTS